MSGSCLSSQYLCLGRFFFQRQVFRFLANKLVTKISSSSSSSKTKNSSSIRNISSSINSNISSTNSLATVTTVSVVTISASEALSILPFKLIFFRNEECSLECLQMSVCNPLRSELLLLLL